MSQTCKVVFLDSNGKASADYYGNLHLGSDNARKIYVERNARHANAKFQKNKKQTVMEYIDRARSMRRPEEGGDNKYKDLDGRSYNRATEFLSRLQNPFEMEETAKQVAINNRAKEILHTDYERFGIKKKHLDGITITQIKEEYKEAWEEAQAWPEEDPETFEKRVQKILDLWNFKTEAGTEVHNVIENYIRERKNDTYIDEDGDLDIKAIKAAALEGVGNQVQYNKLLDQIEKFLSIVGKGKKLRFEEEVTIYDPELGIAGTIDLLAYDEDGNVYVFDYKTKERGKEWLFDAKGKLMKDPAGRLYDNKETHGELQTTLYRIMLERAGLNVVESRILYLEADVVEYGDELRYENFNHKKDVYLKYHKTEVGRLIKQVTGIDINQGSTEIGNEIHDTLSTLIGDDASFDDYRNLKKTIDRRLNSPLIDDDGKEYFLNYLTGQTKKEYFKSTDKESRRKQLEDYYRKEQEIQKNLSDNLIKFFNEGKEKWPTGGRDNYATVAATQAKNLLAGIDRDTHTLEKVKNFAGFEGITHDILIAKSRLDGSARIINVSRRDSVPMSIKDKQRPKDKNMFASKITDNGLKYKYGMDGMEATDENFKLLRAGMIAMELKKQGIVAAVTSVSNGAITGRMSFNNEMAKPTSLGMQNILPQLKIMKDVMGDIIPANLAKNLSNVTLMNPKKYNPDYLDNLYALIETDFAILGRKGKEALKNVLYNDRENKNEIIKTLIKTQSKIAANLKTSKREDLMKNMEYRLISQVILQLTHVDLNIGDFSKTMAGENRYRSTGRIADKAIQVLDTRVRYTEQRINQEFKDFQRQHGQLVKDLMKEKGVIGAKMNMHVLFKDMYKIDPHDRSLTPEQKAQRAESLFMLKEEGSKEFNDLSKAEQAYIRFFNTWVNKGFQQVLEPERYAKVEKGEYWRKGLVPLIDASLPTKRAQEEDLKEKVKITIDGMFNSKIKNTQETFKAINTRLENRFIEQTGSGIQNGDTRLTMLGITPSGEAMPDYDRALETNLEAVLNRFMSDNLRSAMYEETLGVYNAINLVAMIDEHEHFNTTDEVRKFAEDFIKIKVFNQYKEEGKTAEKVDSAQKVMSALALGLSPKQLVLETCTNLFGSTAAVMQQAMMGKSKRFNIAEFSRAGAMVMGDRSKGYTSKDLSRAEAIVREFGIYKADSEAQARAEMQEARKNGWFQSKWLYHLNNLPFKFFKSQTFIAELIHLGIIDTKNPALTLNDEGKLIYNPANDKRWEGIFADADGKKLKDIKRPDGGYEKNKDHAYYKLKKYESFLKEMEEEDGIDEFGRPTRPLSVKEIASMKDYAMSVYGSIDKDAKVLAEISAWGRMFLKFKQWAIAKKDNYWTPTHQSQLRGNRKWITDPENEDGGYWEWEAESMEGIIQTIVQLGRGIKEVYRSSEKGKLGQLKTILRDMNEVQRGNMAKLGADAVLAIVLTIIFGALFDDEKFKKGPGKILVTAATNSVSDINILLMSDNLMKSGPLATVSYLSRGIKNMWTMIAGSATGDFEAAGVAAEKMYEMTGLGKTLNSFND